MTKTILPYRIALALLALGPTLGHSQQINLLTEESYPFQFTENKKLAGMAVEVVAEMFKRAEVPFSQEVLSWQAAYDRVQLYPNTCLYSAARTEDRERLFKWIGPIVQNKWAVFAKKGFKGSVSKPDDLREYRIGVLQGDAKERYLKNLAVPFRVAHSDDAAIPTKLTLNRTEPGKVDLWVTGYYSGVNFAGKSSVKDVVPVWVFEQSDNYLACYFGISKSLTDKLGVALASMKRDGTYDVIVGRYEAKGRAK